MATQMQFEITPHPAMHMRPSAMLVGLAEILALPSVEMERAVAQELEDNPALERVAEAACGFCGGRATACPVCGAATDRLAGRSARHPGSDRLDGAANLPSEERPEQVLLRDVLTVLPGDDRALAELVVGSLNARGFLGEAPADLARRLHVAPDRVHRIVAALREVGHPGIAAVDLRESLILQLDSLSGQNPGESSQAIVTERGQGIAMLTRRIVTDHMTALGQGRFSAIAQALGVSADDVREARAFIQRELSPSPAERVCAERWSAPQRIPARPDLIIVERADKPGHYAVELAEADAAITDHDGNSVHTLVRRADGFLAKLERRWRTLRLIGTYLVDRQRGFIQHGPSSMVSLTRAETARAVSLSESMVSRAVAGKFALLPAGRVMPLADFFDCSLRVRAELSRLITAEERPLSDSELACLLHRRGYDVARRTVAKYRDRLGILPAGLR